MEEVFDHATSMRIMRMFDDPVLFEVALRDGLINATNINRYLFNSAPPIFSYTRSHAPIEWIKLCVALGADLNLVSRYDKKETLLHKLVHLVYNENKLAIVRFVLEAGARQDIPDADGKYPLSNAIIDISSRWVGIGDNYQHVRNTVSILLDFGADATLLSDPHKAVIREYMEYRSDLRMAAVATMRVCQLTQNMDLNVIKMIGKHIWSERADNNKGLH